MPAVLVVLVVVFLPVFWLSSLSFYNAAGELSMENYARIFESALYQRTFVVTFQISVAVTVICVLLGYPLCYWLTKVSDKTAAILMVFVLVPFWTSVLLPDGVRPAHLLEVSRQATGWGIQSQNLIIL